jgi:hypothetical protein
VDAFFDHDLLAAVRLFLAGAPHSTNTRRGVLRGARALGVRGC